MIQGASCRSSSQMTPTSAALLFSLLTATAAPQTPTPPPLHAEQATPDDLTRQAQALVAQSQPAAAEQLLTQALTLSPNHPPANLALGQLQLAQHRYPEAMDRFEAVLATDLRNPSARTGELTAATELALDTRKAGHPDAAFLCLQHAREHLPDDPTLLLDLGILAEQLHQLPIAQDALETALKLHPEDPQTLYALSRVELDREHFADSERHLRAYLRTHPNDATAHFGLGHLLQMQQHIDDAKAEFGRSLDLQPLQTESYYQLGQIALDAGDPDTAKPLFSKTLARDPHHGGALTGLGILSYRRKNFAAARTELAEAVAGSPDYQPAHYYLGLTLARLGQTEASTRELKLATDLAHSQDPHAAPAAPPSQAPQPGTPPPP